MPLGPPAMSPSYHLLRKSEAKIRFLDVAENFNQGALHHVGRCFALLSQLGERGQGAAVTPTVKMQSVTALPCAGQPFEALSTQNTWGGPLGSQRTAHDGTGREQVAGVLYQVREL